MKKIITIFIVIEICLASALNAQWMQQQTPVTVFLRDIKFVNENIGWAVGDGGTILKTTNSGINWESISNPAGGKPLFSVSPVNANVIYVVGWFETILKTTNGGSNWIEIRNGPGGSGDSYEGVYFINENTGWICGSGQKILKTTNGGQDIDSSFVFVGTFHDLYFGNASTGLATMNGGVYKTTNGGVNWFLSNLNNGGSQSQFKKISVVNNQHCWVIGNDDRIFKSTDFGSNWVFIDTLVGTNQSRSIGFANTLTGWAGGLALYKSTDGGFSWDIQNVGAFPVYYTSINFVNDSTGWVCSQFGKIFHTTNAGGITSIHGNQNLIPVSYKLFQNYPNPFNPTTSIKYYIPQREFVKVSVYDISGQLIETLVSEIQNYGYHNINYNSGDLASGIYFYELNVNGLSVETKKMIFIK